MLSLKRKRATKSISAQKVAENDDVLTEILLRLPIKSLNRFKCVSKQFLSLISSPSFTLLHAKKSSHSQISGLILNLSDLHVGYDGPKYDFIDPEKRHDDEIFSNPLPSRFLTFVEEYRAGIEIVESCNGLLLCRTSHVIDLRTSYYVYNPATRNYITVLPRPQVRRGKGSSKFGTIYRMSLAFDPSISPHYKVVCLRKVEENKDRFRIEIYSSETRSWWPSSVVSFAAKFNIVFSSGVYWNGSVHWLNPFYPSLRFDVDEERVYEMPVPTFQDNHRQTSFPCMGEFDYFGESRGHLHLVCRRFEKGTKCFNVYEMENNYSGWFVKYSVDLAKVSFAFQYMSVLCVVRGECEEDSYLVMHISGKILRYNFKTETLDNLSDVEPLNLRSGGYMFSRSSKAYQYIESLASV